MLPIVIVAGVVQRDLILSIMSSLYFVAAEDRASHTSVYWLPSVNIFSARETVVSISFPKPLKVSTTS